MMTTEEARKIDPKLESVPDEELQQAICEAYNLADLSLDEYFKKVKGQRYERIR